MDYPKGQGPYSPQMLPGRRSREERRSLSETLADGTSKFFSSMVAKKNGLFSDISNKIENTFAPKTDTISNSTGSDASVSPPTTPPATAAQSPAVPPVSAPVANTASSSAVPNTPPPRPPPPKRLPSMGSSHEKTNVIKRMSSMPAYSRTESKPESEYFPQSGRGPKDDSHNNKYNIGGMNVSFDQPIYAPQRDSNEKPAVDNNKPRVAPSTATSKLEDSSGYASHQNKRISGSAPNQQNVQQPSVPASNHKKANTTAYSTESTTSPSLSQSQPVPAPRAARSPGNTNTTTNAVSNSRQSPSAGDNSGEGEERIPDYGLDQRQLRREQNKSSSSGEWSDRRQTSEDSSKSSHNERYSDSSGTSGGGHSHGHKKTPKLATARRSSTVDEMLFDDYVDPQIETVLPPPDTPPENLICFEPEGDVTRSDSSGTDGNGNSRGMLGGTSVDSSDVEYGGLVVPRSGSMGSDKSWSSSYSVDSQPDDLTLECMEFMKSFVDKVFQMGEEISQTDKAKFGELCQYFPGRLWFSRYVNSQRVHNKCVNESIFFRLMQYFAVSLFECNEAEDYSPAKTLMNMCFTFFYEAPSMNGGQSPTGNGQSEKVFLYTYMRDQPIWQSLRFWNAAFFDAVQCERSRKPMPTNSAENQTVTDDKQFQENITFGQLGTFACNMRSFGLSKELCLEFLRKQSTIANLQKDQVKLLKENIERVREN